MNFNHIFKSVVFWASAVVFALALDAAPTLPQRPNPLLNRRRTPLTGAAQNRTPPAPAAGASSTASGDAAAKPEMKEAPALNWDAAPADIVLQAYAEQVNKTVITDPSTPKATITLKSKEGQKLSKEEYLYAIEVALELNGIHIEPHQEKFILAMPTKDAPSEPIKVYLDPAEHELEESGKVIGMLIPFKYIALEDAQKALEGFKSAAGKLTVFDRIASILVIDKEYNIKRMVAIRDKIDIETPVLENVFVRQIKNATASDIKTALEAIVQESQKELEKNGKKQSSAQPAAPASPFARRLGQQQQQQPANTPSLVVTDADRGMIRGKVLILADERSNKLVIVTQKPNMDFFDKVIEQLDIETIPDTVVKVYRLKYAEAEEVSDMINDLIGNASSSRSSSKSSQNQNAKAGSGANLTRSNTAVNAPRKSANQRSGDAKAGELSKDNTTVLADKRINGLVVMTNKELVPVVESIIESMDVKLSQVLIETCIIEVTLGDNLQTGIDWVQNGRYQGDGGWVTQTKTGAHGLPYYNYTDGNGNVKSMEYTGTDSVTEGETTWTKFGDALTENVWAAGELSKGAAAGYFTGNSGYAQMLGGGSDNGAKAASILEGTATNVFGSALNYVFKSDKLNLTAIIQATKTDSRTKYIASPIVMTVDNKEATIEATQARKFLTNYQTSSSYYGSTPAPQYESKDIGIKIKVTPKINPNGTVMLEVEEEYSQVGAKQTILDPNSTPVSIDTSLTRKMSADALLENRQTVILCGLTETSTVESETGIPILKDIPWIGKWLFSKVSQDESRSELIIFMTPYVLDDAEIAQAEALRRKKALSDPKPWDDHGWSLSELADPVSKKEQMRRLKDEWKKQDRERKTKLEIEAAKLKRAKELEKMSEEERKFWLEQHKEELDEEHQKELEEKMLDKESQEELKKLAEQIRTKKLKEAESEIKKADDAAKFDNERAKFDAAKAEAEASPSSEASTEQKGE